METVVVKDVEKAGDWYEVTFTDGRTASTKSQKLADAAFAGRGSDVEVEVNTRGKFTYLNKLGDLSDRPTGGAGGAARGGRTGGGGYARREETVPDAVAKQWAIGRAIELLALKDEEVGVLSDDQLRTIQLNAQSLYTLRGNIK